MIVDDEEKTSEEIERDVEETRTRLNDTFEALKDRMTPPDIAQDLLGLVQGGSEVGGHVLKRAIAEHPLLAMLIGAGLAMMFAGTGAARDSDADQARRATGAADVAATEDPEPVRHGPHPTRTRPRGPDALVIAALGLGLGTAIGLALSSRAAVDD